MMTLEHCSASQWTKLGDVFSSSAAKCVRHVFYTALFLPIYYDTSLLFVASNMESDVGVVTKEGNGKWLVSALKEASKATTPSNDDHEHAYPVSLAIMRINGTHQVLLLASTDGTFSFFRRSNINDNEFSVASNVATAEQSGIASTSVAHADETTGVVTLSAITPSVHSLVTTDVGRGTKPVFVAPSSSNILGNGTMPSIGSNVNLFGSGTPFGTSSSQVGRSGDNVAGETSGSTFGQTFTPGFPKAPTATHCPHKA
jgi:hypothetical protein